MTDPLKLAKNADAWPYAFEHWQVERMYVDKDYQRPLSSLVRKLVKRWDARLLMPVVISVRKGNPHGAIVDGQTRWSAAKQLGIKTLPALVFRGTREEEAELFASFQSERRGINAYRRFHAALVANNPAALEVDQTVRRYGYEVMEGTTDTHPWGIAAVKALEEAFEQGQLEKVLTVTSRAWPVPSIGERAQYGRGHPLNNELIVGLTSFINDAIDLKRLAGRLGKTNPQELSIRASHLRQGRGLGGRSANYMRQVLDDVYRSRRVTA